MVRESTTSLGWKLIGEDNDESEKQNYHIIWIDRAFKENTFLVYHKWQCINNFPPRHGQQMQQGPNVGLFQHYKEGIPKGMQFLSRKVCFTAGLHNVQFAVPIRRAEQGHINCQVLRGVSGEGDLPNEEAGGCQKSPHGVHWPIPTSLFPS